MTISNQIVSFKISGINFSGTATQLNYGSGVTAGTCTANKSLVVDSNKTISDIERINSNILSANILLGTITTAAQPNITSIGTLTNLTVSNNLILSGHNGTNGLTLGGTLVTATGAQLNYNNITTIGTAQASKALIIDASRNITNIGTLTANSIVATTLNVGGSNLTTSAAQLNYNSISTPGIAEASKTLVLNSSSNITSINSLSATSLIATNLTGTLQTAAQPNITSLGALTGLTLTGAVTGITNLDLSGNITGATSISATSLTGTLQTAAQPNITSLGTISSLDVTGNITTAGLLVTTITLGGSVITATAAQINTLSAVVSGSAAASKALVLDASRNIININSLTSTTINSTNLTGTLQTAAQTGITSLGTLTGLTLSGAITGVTNLTLTGNITGAASISATNITGTLQTVAQSNITSLGTLSSLLVSGNTGIGTSSASKQLEVNHSTGGCLRLSFGASTGNATKYSDLSINNSGDLIITTSTNVINLSSKVIVGGTSTLNELQFNGLSGNSSNTFITERFYTGSKNELYLYKGGVTDTTNGPSRIRVRAAEIRFQTYNANESYSSMADNNDRMIIDKDGLVGINTSTLTHRLNITATNSNFINMIYGANSAALLLLTDGTLQLKSSNNVISIGDTTNLDQTLIIGANNNTSTSGLMKIGNTSGTCYITSGISSASGATADLIFTDMGKQTTSAFGERILILKSSGRVGISTSTPARQLEIAHSTGSCLRLSYGSSIYCDQLVSSTGVITFSAAGSSPSFSFIGGNVSATLSTASQPFITSLGILTSLTMTGTLSGVTNITMTGTLSGATTITATNLAGTLTTSAQTAITSVGNLTTLSVVGNTKIGVVASAATDLLHIEGNSTTSLGIQIENRNATDLSGTHISFMGFHSTNSDYDIAKIKALYYYQTTTYGYGGLAFYTRNTSSGTESLERVRIDPSGNVGINTTSPSYKLDVNGQFNAVNYSLNGTLITATAAKINYVDITTIGMAEASKALVLDSSRNITNINSLTATSLVGTLTTATQNNITSIGELTSPLSINSTNNGLTLKNTNASSRTNIRFTNNTRSIELGLRGTTDSAPTDSFYIYDVTANAFRLIMDNTGNIGIGMTPTYKLHVNGGLGTNSLYLNSIQVTSTATEINTLAGITAGTVSASKAIVVDTNKDIISLRNLTATGLIKSTIAGQGFSHNDGIINLVSFVNGSSYTYAYLGTATNHGLVLQTNTVGRLYIDQNGNVGIGNTPNYKLDVNGQLNTTNLVLNGTNVSSTATELNYLAGLTPGTASASKSLVLDTNKDLTGIRYLTLSNVSYAKLTVDASGADIYMGNTSSSGYCTFFMRTNSAQYAISTGGSGSSVSGMLEFQSFNSAGTFLGRAIVISGVNVGIGTSNPSYKLDVTGNFNVTGNIYQNGSLLSSSSSPYITGITEGTATASKALILDSNKDITGIRNITLNNSTSGLTIDSTSSNIYMGNTSSNGYCQLIMKTNTAQYSLQLAGSGSSTNGILEFNALNSSGGFLGRAMVISGLNVGIGTISPSYKLDVNGNVGVTGSVSVGGVSVVNSNGTINNKIGVDLTHGLATNKTFSDLLFYQFTGSIAPNQVPFYAGTKAQALKMAIYFVNAFINDIKNLENDNCYDQARNSAPIGLGLAGMYPVGTLPTGSADMDNAIGGSGTNYYADYFRLIIASNGSNRIWSINISYAIISDYGSISTFYVQTVDDSTSAPYSGTIGTALSSSWQITEYFGSSLTLNDLNIPGVLPIPFTFALNF